MEKEIRNRVVVMGATSGLGQVLAKQYISEGWSVGVAGRNVAALESLCELAPERVEIEQIDITREDAAERLEALAKRLGGMDVYLHCSGILPEEGALEERSQIDVVATNALGFARMISAAYRYFRQAHKEGRRQCAQIAAISSIAGIRGLGLLPAYSASKAFDIHYLEALRQKAHTEHLPLTITDIRPGWTRTPLLSSGRRYMLEMDQEEVAERIWKAIRKHRSVATIGLRWQLLTAAERLLPECLWRRLHLPLWRNIKRECTKCTTR